MSNPLFPLEGTLGGEHPDRRKIKTGAHPWAPSQLDAWEGIGRTEAFSMKAAGEIAAAKAAAQITEAAARRVCKAHGIKREHKGEPWLQALAWDLGDGALTYEAGMTALVAAAIEADRAQRGIIAQIAGVLDDRGAHAAAQLVRDTDPDDDLWNNYIGPMIDSIEADYTGMAKEINA